MVAFEELETQIGAAQQGAEAEAMGGGASKRLGVEATRANEEEDPEQEGEQPREGGAQDRVEDQVRNLVAEGKARCSAQLWKGAEDEEHDGPAHRRTPRTKSVRQGLSSRRVMRANRHVVQNGLGSATTGT